MAFVKMGDGGMGGFLNPPGHPEHTMRVHELCPGWKKYGPDMSSLSSYAENGTDESCRDRCRDILAAYVGPATDSPEFQAWARQVMGYFRNCWRQPECVRKFRGISDAKQWNCDMLYMGAPLKLHTIDDHAGVNFILKYYPGWVPAPEDFKLAKWGK